MDNQENACSTCCAPQQLEMHHPAGRANNSGVVVPVCRRCHETLTRWQSAAGIELAHTAERDQLARDVALLVGAAHVFVLAAHHDGQAWPAGRSLLLLSRALGCWTGRALPSSLVPAPFPRPSRLPRTEPVNAALAELLGDIARELVYEGPLPSRSGRSPNPAELPRLATAAQHHAQRIAEVVFVHQRPDDAIALAYRECVATYQDERIDGD